MLNMFRLRQIFNVGASRLSPKVKSMSTNSDSFLNVSVHKDGIAVIKIQRPPVNGINLELLQQIFDSLKELENDRCKGIILSSSLPQVFSAGLDLTELVKPSTDRLFAFVKILHEVSIKLYGFNAVTTVAINGTTAAGGCVLTMLMDYRVMVNRKSTISLNDSEIGIVPLKWISEAMCELIGRKQATLALTASTKFTPEEAFKVGLVEELAVDNNDAIERCKQFIRKFDNIPSTTRATIKQNIRQALLNDMKENKEEYIETLVSNVIDPMTQGNIEMLIQNLRSKSK